ncbi:hypothetical protein Fmac_000947 [Flemingia macrophylla]|uniref:Uncharacterized protein n=1 Tax=Flemingia macrophylla TaxID=520843 RepID=A0ABD1NFN8_9FABA
MEDTGKPLKSCNPSLKVVDVTAGEAHTLLLTGDGSVYCWGKGMFGRLGTGSEKDELFPVKLNFGNPNPNGTEDTVKIVGIAAGAYHSLVIAGYAYLTLHTSCLPISPSLVNIDIQICACLTSLVY